MVRKWRIRPGSDEDPGDGSATGVFDGGDLEGDFVSTGWQSVDEAIGWLYGSARPSQVVNYPLSAALGDTLQGCSVYAAAGYWHFVTFGLSSLLLPESRSELEPADWGFELTLRTPRDGDEPPQWPFSVLGELASRVSSGALDLQAGNRIDLRRSVTGHPTLPDAPETELTVFAVTLDPQLGRIRTPGGVVSFLQIVGVTAAEKQQMVATSTAAVLDELAGRNPLLITDPARALPS